MRFPDRSRVPVELACPPARVRAGLVQADRRQRDHDRGIAQIGADQHDRGVTGLVVPARKRDRLRSSVIVGAGHHEIGRGFDAGAHLQVTRHVGPAVGDAEADEAQDGQHHGKFHGSYPGSVQDNAQDPPAHPRYSTS